MAGGEDRDRSAAEFLRLFSHDQSKLFRYIVALVTNLQDAEDILGETTLTLWREFDHFSAGTNFLAWARRIAYLRVLEYYRVRARRFPEDLLAVLASEFERREAEPDARLGFLADCRKKLRLADQTLLERRYESNVTVQDLAQQMGRPVNSVSKSLGRIRRTLMECIQRAMSAVRNEGSNEDGTRNLMVGHK
jgi:RNA polymerase sigma-70 factor (ECF subfamily)